ncbi:hypothetical protein G6O67_006852 [Ophiocordyceps sinensis]|uniref:Uncharacterized protein n=3 Tax=Ophiocordyceps sinensis TaxID=72228 RepID=A0A8H4LXK0_9HYPO|nr:hypothetical protein OCS_05543 [Ophiocordyceps sinensis CO18]KAF4506807.1 hypothetical protein G6O67_006852 [Ophiocordyceps sinensis]
MASPSTSILAITVVPYGSAARGTPRSIKRSIKRNISPTAFQPSPKRSLLLVSPSRRPPRAGQQHAIGEYRPPRQHFPDQQAQAVDEDGSSWHSNHVLVPFDMRDPTVALDSGEPMQMLLSIFPQTLGLMESVPRLWLNFLVEQLPSRPWPLTVGGLPITIRTHSQGRGPLFPRMRNGNMRISICAELDAGSDDYFSDSDFQRLAGVVARHFRAHNPDIELCEIIVTMQHMIFVVLDGHDLNVNHVTRRLPGKIARCHVGYLHHDELHRPKHQPDCKAKHVIDPIASSGVSDTTAYSTLRPGVMVWSDQVLTHAHPLTYATTSGVLVRGNANHTAFMTGASHGIGDSGTVYQRLPNGTKRIFGEAVQEVSYTDIALVALQSGVEFTNVTFEDENGNVPTFTRLLGERPQDLDTMPKWPKAVYLNSPFSGIMEGCLVAKGIKIEGQPADPRFVMYNWTYMGQAEGAGSNQREPPDGVCGSAIWDDEGVVVGFFRSYVAEGPLAGFCASVSAAELIKAGYVLAK